MDRPTKAGYYWFRGIINDLSWTGKVIRISCPVCILADMDEVEVPGFGSFDLPDFEGEWQELTEEMLFGDTK